MKTTKHIPTDAELEQLAEKWATQGPDLSHATVWTDPGIAGLLAATRARHEADARVLEEVRKARADGVPWAKIAAVLGVSHQAAMKKYKPLL